MNQPACPEINQTGRKRCGCRRSGTSDSRLDVEQFCTSLNSDQQNLIKTLQDGFKIPEIVDILNISERNIRLMACEIARQRRKFDGEA